MDSRTALTLSIGVLGGVAVAVTAELITVPIWVVFLAWASFFFVGGGVAGWVRSVSSNIVGVVIASASLYAAYLMGGSLLVTAIAVGVGSAADGAGVVGAAVGHHSRRRRRLRLHRVDGGRQGQRRHGHHHFPPRPRRRVACVLGASFGLLSEYLATVMTKKASTETAPTEGSPA